MKSFAIVGTAGYIAPRHLKAVKEVGGVIRHSYDISDSVGVLDSYFPKCMHHTDEVWFWKHLQRGGKTEPKVDTLIICSPNYTHYDYIMRALDMGMNVICEKPLIIHPWEMKHITERSKKTGKKVYSVLQLRHHPSVIEKKQSLDGKRKKVVLNYVTSRGKWYDSSWKMSRQHSGGLPMNIGIHFFDMLLWMFGEAKSFQITDGDFLWKLKGTLTLENADVEWFLSIDGNDIKKVTDKDVKVHRSITIDGDEFEFSNVFADLHTKVYQDIIDGNGYTEEDAMDSISLAYKISNNYNG